MQNDAAEEVGESIRETLRHNVFVQVTATPYALLLQNIDSPVRPSFTRLLEPGPGYTGGEAFFSAAQVDDELAPLVFVDSDESSRVQTTDTHAPEGLARAIAFFLMGACALRIRRQRPEPEGYKFLCHTSPRQDDHTRFAGVIRSHVDLLLDDGGQLRPDNREAFEWAYANLSATTAVPSMPELIAELSRRIQHRRVIVVNAASDQSEFGSAFNFLVGGNILGRGLTIENLLATYYLRMPRTTQMDTMLQHARMFGYRADIMPYTRVFLPAALAARFARITEAEESLRALLADQAQIGSVPVQVVGSLRPTRTNVLDPNALGGIRAGQQVYPSMPAFTVEQIGTSGARIDALLEMALGEPWSARLDQYVDVPLDAMIELVRTVRSGDPDATDWEPEILTSVLRSIAGRYGNRGRIVTKEFRRTKYPLVSGALSGPEQQRARVAGAPVLFLFRETGDHDPWANVPFWYPTLVFPGDMANTVFNVT
ncbi:MAG: Z1 domain-containing protein [Kofleriaceae bacterium]